MQKMLDVLDDKINEKDTEVLNQFYDSVKEKAQVLIMQRKTKNHHRTLR